MLCLFPARERPQQLFLPLPERIMPVKQVITEGTVPVIVYTDEVDAIAREQLVNVSKLPFVHHMVRVCSRCGIGH